MSNDEQAEHFGFSNGSLSGRDEVEGHAEPGPVRDEGEDAEGHGRRVLPVADEGDDVEGHGRRGIPVADGADDTEGHASRGRG